MEKMTLPHPALRDGPIQKECVFMRKQAWRRTLSLSMALVLMLTSVLGLGGSAAAEDTTSAVKAAQADPVAPTGMKSSSGLDFALANDDAAFFAKRDSAVYTVAVTPSVANVNVGSKQVYAATVQPSVGPQTVTWTSSADAVATVSTNGEVTGVKPGVATITAATTTAPAVKGTATINVNGVVLKGTESVSRRSSVTLTPTAYLNGAVATVTWKSSDTNIATVNNGVVTGEAVGTATITATAGAYSATCAVTVTEMTANVIRVSASMASPLRFSTVAASIASECSRVLGGSLRGVALNGMDQSNGTIFVGYVSESDPGSGARYNYEYANSSSGFQNLTYIPAATASSTVNITYTAYGSNPSSSKNSFSGTIQVSVSATGDVSYSTTARQPVVFDAAKFNTVCLSRKGMKLDYVTFDLPAASRGVLYYNYTNSPTYDTKVKANEPYRYSNSPAIGRVTFVPGEGAGSTVTIGYTAYAVGGGTYSGNVTITIGGNASGDVTYSTPKNTAVVFDSDDFTTACKRYNGNKNFKYVSFTLPSSSLGTLYYDYKSNGDYDRRVSDSTSYYRSDYPYVYKVAFVPASNYTGSVSIPFTGRDTDNGSFSGTVVINVGGSGSGDVNYSVAKNSYVDFDEDDFNSASRSITGNTLDFVTFSQPGSSKGTLYYNYSHSSDSGTKVSESTQYRYNGGSPYLDEITFVPDTGYTGTVSIDFTGRDTSGRSFTGTVSIKVGTSSSDGDVNYSVAKNGTVGFDASDFNDACKDYNNFPLDYLRFTTLPSSSKGTLYYKYNSSGGSESKVSTGTNYKRSGSPNLDDITFVADKDYTGTVSIPFSAYDTDGGRFTGSVSIQVGKGGVAGTKITYNTAKDTKVKFSADDFNQASQNHDDYNLQYVRFTLPPSSKGTLYLNYSSSSSSGTKLSASTNYNLDTSPSINNITFVPATGYTGTVEIDYSGWDTHDNKFTGTVQIRVGSGTTADVTVTYKTTTGRPVVFAEGAFNTASKDYDDNALDYVEFHTLPASNLGTLYQNYTSGGSLNKVSSSTSYYRNDTPSISTVTFVPATGYSGTAEIPFTGWDTAGQEFDGKVVITVEQAVAMPVRYSVAAGAARFGMNEFSNVCQTLMGQPLVKVRFSPPASYGKLVFGFTSVSQYDGQADSGTDCYTNRAPNLGTMAFIPNAGITGTVSIPYVGEDANGYSYIGTVEVTVPAAPAVRFTDMGNHGWAAAAVEYLYQQGVVKGTSATEYSPKGPTKRGDFAVMIVRAFKFPTTAGASSFVDVPTDSYYAQEIAAAKNLGIVQGDGSSFRPEFPVTRQDAMMMLQRAMRSAGRVVNDGAAADLGAFKDANKVSNYAVPAVASMVKLGIVNGDNAGNLKPTAYINRAEMAVILYRALTMAH